MNLRVDQNQTSTGPKRIKTVNEGNTGVRQEGKVGNSGIINCAAYSGFGKPDSQAVYVSFACEYMIYALKKLLL